MPEFTPAALAIQELLGPEPDCSTAWAMAQSPVPCRASLCPSAKLRLELDLLGSGVARRAVQLLKPCRDEGSAVLVGHQRPILLPELTIPLLALFESGAQLVAGPGDEANGLVVLPLKTILQEFLVGRGDRLHGPDCLLPGTRPVGDAEDLRLPLRTIHRQLVDRLLDRVEPLPLRGGKSGEVL